MKNGCNTKLVGYWTLFPKNSVFNTRHLYSGKIHFYMTNQSQPNNPLHGITLAKIVTDLEQHFGWQELAQRISINCFKKDPSVKSSLKFLRKTPWARQKVEQLYIDTFRSHNPWQRH